ncbi:MAG: response regulator [Magnetococcales bacterium]|nr:response regulator [Magnetococcales bacterium]
MIFLILLSSAISYRDLLQLGDGFDRYAEMTEEAMGLVSLEQTLADIRQTLLLAMISGDEKTVRGSQEMLDHAQQQVEQIEQHLLQAEESVSLHRIAAIVQSLQSGLPRLTELLTARRQLFYAQWLPAEQTLSAQLAKMTLLYREQQDQEGMDRLLEAEQHLQKVGLMLARLSGMNDAAELPEVAYEGRRLLDALEGLGEKPVELQAAADHFWQVLQQALQVERENSALARTILQGEATEFATLTRGVLAKHNRILQQLYVDTSERNHAATLFVGGVVFLVCLVSLLIASWLSKTISTPMQRITEVMSRLTQGELAIVIPGIKRQDEIGEMARALEVLQRSMQSVELQHWIKNNSVTLNQIMLQASGVKAFSQGLIEAWVPIIGGVQGALFYFDEQEQRLQRWGGYALTARAEHGSSFALGESLVGQCALNRQVIELENVPYGYAWISSGIGETEAIRLTIVPLLWQDRLQGVLEVASLLPRSARQQQLLLEVADLAALNMEMLRRTLRTQELLQQTQQQAEALRQSQAVLMQKEDALLLTNQQLRERGEMLEAQTEELRTSTEELRVQGEELRVANEALAEKAKLLEEREKSLVEARGEAEKRAFERELASRYKSEFLANMSHELRTPLNSLLILAESLSSNSDGNLLPEQVESATIIHESGTHLLRLINDILDIAKVEAGRMELFAEVISLSELLAVMERRFRRMAQGRGIRLRTLMGEHVPDKLHTDRGKLEQILTNLLGNAIKFTEQGEVRLEVLAWEGQGVKLQVSDSGIGIAAENLENIFEAFAQADGTTNRRFGGSGLGLTIARKLAQLLGGEIKVSSQLGVGSQFTVWLPDAGQEMAALACIPTEEMMASGMVRQSPDNRAYPEDDREQMDEGEPLILVVEDDPVFAGMTYAQARNKGLRCLLARDGRNALLLAQRYQPMGIILDVGLPDMDGWEVMNRLKQDPQTQRIPVHFVSALDARLRAMGMGAVGFLTKPITQEQLITVFDRVTEAAQGGKLKHVLVMDADALSRQEVVQLLRHAEVVVEEAASGEGCLIRLRSGGIHCLILDLGVAVNEGVAFLHRLVTELGEAMPPVVVYSPRNLTTEELIHFREFTDSIIIRSDRSDHRLQEEVENFLTQVQGNVALLKSEAAPDFSWEGRKILVVDDDMRNTFALSKVLRSKGMKVLMAQDGNKALAQLASNRDVQLVLMDIMMPDKDGYQTMQEMRRQEQWQSLPIVALTAKAMSGDRERCLAAGANDYLTKPVNLELLLVKMAHLLSEQEQKTGQ